MIESINNSLILNVCGVEIIFAPSALLDFLDPVWCNRTAPFGVPRTHSMDLKFISSTAGGLLCFSFLILSIDPDEIRSTTDILDRCPDTFHQLQSYAEDEEWSLACYKLLLSWSILLVFVIIKGQLKLSLWNGRLVAGQISPWSLSGLSGG